MPARRTAAWLTLLAAAALAGACRRTYVVVPQPDDRFRPTDTLRGRLRGNDVRVTFRYDTVTRIRTVYVTDTLWRDTLRLRDTVRLVRRDTIRLARRDTIYRVDTVRVGATRGRVDTVVVRDTVILRETPTANVPGAVGPTRAVRVDTVRRADTVVVAGPARVDTVRIVRLDTVRRVDTVYVQGRDVGGQRGAVGRVDTVYVGRTDEGGRRGAVGRSDTVVIRDTIVRHDTVRITVRDTVRRVDTVRVAGRRVLFVPPGQYPPAGQCRVWIHDRPPGQQRDPAPCDALGEIPAGAFILFGGEAWDFDYDWLAGARTSRVPREILALKRRP